MMEKYKADVDSQVQYAAKKWGGNLTPYVALAHAQSLASDAMKTYDPSQGNVKTFLSKRLQKLSRIAYKASTPLNIPESRLMGRAKIRDYIDEHVDTFGHTPDPSDIARNAKVSLVEAKNYMAESSSVSNESAFDNISGAQQQTMTNSDVVNSLPLGIRDIGKDLYLGGMKEKDIIKKYSIGRTTFFSKKKSIDGFIKDNAGLTSIQYK